MIYTRNLTVNIVDEDGATLCQLPIGDYMFKLGAELLANDDEMTETEMMAHAITQLVHEVRSNITALCSVEE
jgi:hypothetical protein